MVQLKRRIRIWGLVSVLKIAGLAPGESIALGSEADPPIFSQVNGVYKAAKSATTCADHANLRKKFKMKNGKVDDSQTVFWEGSGNRVSDFVFYDIKSRIISICDKGKIINVQGPGKAADELEVEVSNANLGDWNQDGKSELLISEKQCVEGPCMGNTFVVQVDGDHLIKLYNISSELVEFTDLNLPLQLQSICFTYEFGVAFDFLSLVELDEHKKMALVPYQQIRKRFPTILKKYAARRGQLQNESNYANLDAAQRKQQIAYDKIQGLIFDALHGEKQDVLLRKLNLIVKPFGNDGLSVHCEPATIIKLLTASKS